jgi:hypothetical protein
MIPVVLDLVPPIVITGAFLVWVAYGLLVLLEDIGDLIAWILRPVTNLVADWRRPTNRASELRGETPARQRARYERERELYRHSGEEPR